MENKDNDTAQHFSDICSSFLSPLENKKIISLLNTFIMSFMERSSTFFGKKFHLEFNEIELGKIQDFYNKENMLYADVLLKTNHNTKGFIFLEKKFINELINLIFGNENKDMLAEEIYIGKCGHKITSKLLGILLDAFKASLHHESHFEPHLIHIDEHKNLMMAETISEKFYQMSFKISCSDQHAFIFMCLPEKLIETITSHQNTQENNDIQNTIDMNKDQLKKELIESSMVLRVLLPNMSLKLKDILNLKAGDTIPLPDFTSVDLLIGNKKAYKGTVGQANNVRVVKIIN